MTNRPSKTLQRRDNRVVVVVLIDADGSVREGRSAAIEFEYWAYSITC
jgi:hypothetical protein